MEVPRVILRWISGPRLMRSPTVLTTARTVEHGITLRDDAGLKEAERDCDDLRVLHHTPCENRVEVVGL